MTRILALDLGTACGWALAETEAEPGPNQHCYGTFNLSAGQFSGGGMRFVKFREQLAQMPKPDQVVFEIVRRHRGTAAAHVYGGLLAILTAWCEENKIPYDGRTVQAIKIFSAGKGNASKEEVIKAVEGWGFQPKNDNEADAIALLRLRLSELAPRDPSVPVPAGRREVARKPSLRAACR